MSRPTLQPGSNSPHVIKAKKRVVHWLRKHGHIKLADSINVKSKKYGKAAVRGVKIFQRNNSLKADGEIGPQTWAKLGVKQRLDKRAKAKAWMTWALNHEPSWHYSQASRMHLKQMKARKLPIWEDCSSSSTGCHYVAGFKDPNGRGYDGTGYTGSIRGGPCKQIRLADAEIGDMIIYGPGTGSHMVVIYADAGSNDPLVFSHGQESGPRLYRHGLQDNFHSGSYTVHRAIE